MGDFQCKTKAHSLFKILIIPIVHLFKLIDVGIWEAIRGVLLRIQIGWRSLNTR